MPNRFGTYDARMGDDGGGDWWSQNDPQVVQRAPNAGTPSEQGGIAGMTNTVAAGLPPLQQPAPGSTWAGNQPGATTWQAPGGTATSAVGGPEQSGGDYQRWFMALVGNRPWNQATLNNLAPTLAQYGVKLTPPNAAGDQTKIGLPDGSWVRVGFGEGHPVWIPQGNAGGASGGAYTGPGAIPPPFTPPSFEDLQKEPGFQARYAMGLEGLQRSGAAQGSLLSGGFQKAINRYGQDFATGEYGAAYDRAYRTYMGNYQTQSADPWQRYNQLYQGGLSAALGSKTTPPLNG